MGALWPRFKREDWPLIASQCGNTGGLHVVLNAWASILSSKPRPTEKPRCLEFYEEVGEIINLALQGKISASYIEASLLDQSFVDSGAARVALVNTTDSELHTILQAHTVRMNERIFNDFLETVHAQKTHSRAGNIAAASDELPGTADEHGEMDVDDGTCPTFA